MEKPFVIRDPVHGYLHVCAHERIVVDHSLTQRLRYVGQTGAAHLVYPEARTSRFVHSIGAMHLASRFLVSAVENAASDTQEQLFSAAEALDVVARHQLLSLNHLADLAHHDGRSGLRAAHARLAAGSPAELTKRRALLALLEAAVRLCALFHDLGHLPYSHDFEVALRAVFSDKPNCIPASLQSWVAATPHEKVGHALAALVLEALTASAPAGIRAAYELAKRILDEETPYENPGAGQATILQWLHSLVDGELDVDRADYLLRDGRELGFEFANYDLERLVSSLALVRTDEMGFATAVREQGLSALESFLLSRARSNQLLIRHHKVAQVAAALRYATADALISSTTGAGFLQQLGRLSTTDPMSGDESRRYLSQFAEFDDVWWTGVLRKHHAQTEGLVRDCLDVLLKRERKLRSVWKRKGELGADAGEYAGRLNW